MRWELFLKILCTVIQEANLEPIIKCNLKCADDVSVRSPSYLPERLHAVLPAHPEAGGADKPGHSGLLLPAHPVQLPG